VPAKRLDDVVRELGLPRVDFIKIDVEGHELRVLRGAEATMRTLRPVLLMELQDASLRPQRATPDEIVTLLHEWGYSIGFVQGRRLAANCTESIRGINAVAMPIECRGAVDTMLCTQDT
jgi:hypothetical protein